MRVTRSSAGTYCVCGDERAARLLVRALDLSCATGQHTDPSEDAELRELIAQLRATLPELPPAPTAQLPLFIPNN